MKSISSADNPLVKRIRKLLRDPAAYRKEAQAWAEGEHLLMAWQGASPAMRPPATLVLAETALGVFGSGLGQAAEVVRLPDALFAELSDLPSPGGIGLLLTVPLPTAADPKVASVVLDRVQDAGNVGSTLRSAAAFGAHQVLALPGTAALWSPKVLRAGMGAHFGLRLHEGGAAVAALDALLVPLVAASSHAHQTIREAQLPDPAAWVFGHEGQGVDAALLARCALRLRIPQPGGQESLNVAAAAAVCLYEASIRRAGRQ